MSRMTQDQVRLAGRAPCWRPARLAGALPIVALAGGAVGLLLLARLVLGAPAAAQSAGNRPAGAGDPRLVVQPRTITQVARVAALRLALTASPLVRGPNRFVLTLGEQGRAVVGARVHLVATMPGMLMRPVRFVAGQGRDGRYAAAGALPLFGPWQLTVRVDGTHTAPVVHQFWLRLDLPPALLQEVGTRGPAIRCLTGDRSTGPATACCCRQVRARSGFCRVGRVAMDVAMAQQRRSRHRHAAVPRRSVRDLILWLGEPACHERARVGGKAATLSRLAAAYRVPPGFCLTLAAYALAEASSLTHQEASPSPALPVALYDALATAYRRLADRAGSETPAVAVRSSALDEDGGMASYAGQHETSLNIVGVEAVADAVVHCWRSAWSPRACAYRRAQGRAQDNVQVAVLVQQLIVADSSAVLFSAHPVTGSRDEIVVNASWGLGESIVGGTVTPDTYVMRKADVAMVSRQVAAKRRMTVAVPGGTREVDVPRFLQTHSTLTEEQAIEIAHLGLALEATLGRPVDVECAYQDGRLFLLQCRPITTLLGCRAS